jgi:hypothetical protein
MAGKSAALQPRGAQAAVSTTPQPDRHKNSIMQIVNSQCVHYSNMFQSILRLTPKLEQNPAYLYVTERILKTSNSTRPIA